jgi:curli biogenesis system outer membrane secretion channel CsgG
MIVKMIRKTIAAAAFLAAGLLMGCGTSTTGPDGGSKAQTATGVTPSGYPAGEAKDAGSPALASSTEQQYSRDQAEKK